MHEPGRHVCLAGFKDGECRLEDLLQHARQMAHNGRHMHDRASHKALAECLDMELAALLGCKTTAELATLLGCPADLDTTVRRAEAMQQLPERVVEVGRNRSCLVCFSGAWLASRSLICGVWPPVPARSAAQAAVLDQ